MRVKKKQWKNRVKLGRREVKTFNEGLGTSRDRSKNPTSKLQNAVSTKVSVSPGER